MDQAGPKLPIAINDALGFLPVLLRGCATMLGFM